MRMNASTVLPEQYVEIIETAGPTVLEDTTAHLLVIETMLPLMVDSLRRRLEPIINVNQVITVLPAPTSLSNVSLALTTMM